MSLQASGIVGLMFGAGISLVLNGIFLVLSLAMVTFLVHKSSPTRVFLVVFSALFTVLGRSGC